MDAGSTWPRHLKRADHLARFWKRARKDEIELPRNIPFRYYVGVKDYVIIVVSVGVTDRTAELLLQEVTMKRKPKTRETAWVLCFSLVLVATILVAIHALTLGAFAALLAAAVGLARAAQAR